MADDQYATASQSVGNFRLILRGAIVPEGKSADSWLVATLDGKDGIVHLTPGPAFGRKVSKSFQGECRLPTRLLRNWRAYKGLPRQRRNLVFEAILYIGMARVVLMILPFKRVAQQLGELVGPGDTRAALASKRQSADDAIIAADIGWTVARVAGQMPFKAVCLQQALAAHAMLRRRQIPSILHLGSGRDDTGKLIAHAWLDAAGTAVTGYPLGPHIREIGCFVPNCDPEDPAADP